MSDEANDGNEELKGLSRRGFAAKLGSTTVIAAAIANPAAAQQGGGAIKRGASPPVEVNTSYKGRVAAFNFSDKPVSGRMFLLDAVSGSPIPETDFMVPLLPSRKGVYNDVILPTASMPSGSSWEVMAVFLFRGDTADVFGSFEVRKPDGTTVAHFKVEIEGVEAGG